MSGDPQRFYDAVVDSMRQRDCSLLNQCLEKSGVEFKVDTVNSNKKEGVHIRYQVIWRPHHWMVINFRSSPD